MDFKKSLRCLLMRDGRSKEEAVVVAVSEPWSDDDINQQHSSEYQLNENRWGQQQQKNDIQPQLPRRSSSRGSGGNNANPMESVRTPEMDGSSLNHHCPKDSIAVCRTAKDSRKAFEQFSSFDDADSPRCVRNIRLPEQPHSRSEEKSSFAASTFTAADIQKSDSFKCSSNSMNNFKLNDTRQAAGRPGVEWISHDDAAGDHQEPHCCSPGSGSSAAPASIPPRMVQIAPGHWVRLRGADETWQAVANDFFAPTACLACDTTILCIQDADYVLCPVCRSVSPLMSDDDSDDGDDSNAFLKHDSGGTCSSAEESQQHDDDIDKQGESGGGVGLGFTLDDLFRWQEELLSCRRK